MRGSNLTITGSTHYNGSPDLLTVTTAYVTQTDVLIPSLTVRETLLYAASFRLPSSTTPQRRKQLVEEVILELGLKECADTRVGDGVKKGECSGGERRRVSIAIQMLRNPSILFLDEPTTGLDATSALHLVKTLKRLANMGRTIITTIHQPRSGIFSLFDRVTLLSRGRVAYTGPTSDCLLWFDGLLPGGLRPHVNPADYLIDIIAVDTQTKKAEEECIRYRGSFILKNLSFSKHWITVPLCVLLGFVAFFFVSSCSLLHFWTIDLRFSAARTRNDVLDASAGKEIMGERQDGCDVRKVDVELVDLGLEIYEPSLGRRKGRTLDVLESVSTTFQAGELNVILGPSGSGKSSLLNTMARRLRSSPLTRYRTSGTNFIQRCSADGQGGAVAVLVRDTRR